ncbi:Myosin heavy chain [hydrothermal vent metagenome]|uniref:Myosin heavy chain n=1 Tax=hydrothermal vent metagenome TaxID=652676 RepID=A0A1W1CYH6_9ZZZZ
MANSPVTHKLTVIENTSIDTSAVHNEPKSVSHHFKAEMAMALTALDTLYKENISAYANELHTRTHKIEKLQNHLDVLLKEKKPQTDRLQTHQHEIDYMLRLLERLTQEWTQKSLVIRELESELSQLNHSDKEREQILKTRNETLKNLTIEIEEIELSLLENELQKQNILLFLEPIEQEIKSLRETIKNLESEKRYIETTYLHKLSPSSASSNHALIEKS